MQNALTVDVEDYFHVAAFARQIDPATWDQFPLRVERNTHRLLELFAGRGVRATFFVLGWVAERCPNLVRAIAEQGHELSLIHISQSSERWSECWRCAPTCGPRPWTATSARMC